MLTSQVKLAREHSTESLRGRKRLSDSESDAELRRRSKSRDRERDDLQKPKNKNLVSLFEIKLPAASRLNEMVSEPKNLKNWHHRQIRGAFYYNEKMNVVLANTYALDLLKDTTLFISIEPNKTPLHIGMTLTPSHLDIDLVKQPLRLDYVL